MKRLLIGTCIGAFCTLGYADSQVASPLSSETNTTAEATAPAPVPIQEIIVINKEPIEVSVTNFPIIDKQKVTFDANETFNVNLLKPVSLVEKERAQVVILNDTKNDLIVETSVLLGELNTDLQDIALHKIQIQTAQGQKVGLKIHCKADNKLEIMKDVKVFVENDAYMDEEEINRFFAALSKILSIAEGTIENKDFKLTFKTLGDVELNVYTLQKMFGNSRNVEATLIIANEKPFNSKAIMSIKELREFHTILGKFKSTPLPSL